jgi:N-acetylmuramoyl-L-alanine amidase
MIRNVFLRGLRIALFCAASAQASQAVELRDLRLSTGPQSAQLVLQLSEPAHHKFFTLEAPERVVIDLSGTRLAPNVRAPEGTGPVQVIRIGTQPRNVLRVVVQLKSELPVRTKWIGHGASQLVIDIGKPSTTASVPPRPAASAPASSKSPQSVVAAHAPLDGDRDVVVAVDAGHGGQDPGAIGRGGTREKDVVLAVARALAQRIDAEPGMRAVLTRKSDQFLVLRDRIVRARAAKADLFVSIHADSIRDRAITGASVYVLSEKGATDEAARWLAERENAADLMGGVSLTDKDNTLASVLLDLSQSANLSASMVAAERVLLSLDNVGEVRKRQVQQAGFVVLKSPDIPSMLVETAYISNPAEERRLRNDDHQDKLASAIFAGLRGYFEENPPPGTRFASLRRSSFASAYASPPP